MPDNPIIHVTIEADSLADLKAFADDTQADLGCHPVARKVARRFMMHAYLPEEQLATARTRRAAERVTIRVIENATEVGRQRQREVGTGNRFANRGQIPIGLGRKE